MRVPVAALGVLAALVAALSLTAGAEAKPPVRTVTDVFAVTYDIKGTFDHHKSHPESTGEDHLRYQVHGRLPELTFVDGLLQTDQSAVVRTKVKGSATAAVTQADWWMKCTGKKVRLRGLVGIARVENGISFLPALSAEPEGRCIASDGIGAPFTFGAEWPGEGHSGSQTFPVSARSIDVPRWSKPFRVVFEDEKCPAYEPQLSIACSYVLQGKLTLTRVDREVEVNGEVLLPALDPPKLSPKKDRVTTTVECQSGCAVEAVIGVFAGTAKDPKVTPLHKKTVHLEGGRPTTISMPVSAADLAASKRGVLVMTLQAKGGEAQVYPLALGGPAVDVPTMAGAATASGPGVGQKLVLAEGARLWGGALSVAVSNPNGFRAKGSLELRLGKRSLGRAGFAVPAHGERSVVVRLDRGARKALAQQPEARVAAVAGFRDPGGKLRRTAATIVVTRGGTPAPGEPKGPTAPPAEPAPGPDGTYHGSNGLTVLISGGKVVSFNGQITTYCATSESQKLVTFGMFGDDPAPQVGPDGSFAWEATTGYGFVKLKYEGRVSGDAASGKLVVEDRSPMSTGEGRLEFDYCFAGADWTATR